MSKRFVMFFFFILVLAMVTVNIIPAHAEMIPSVGGGSPGTYRNGELIVKSAMTVTIPGTDKTTFYTDRNDVVFWVGKTTYLINGNIRTLDAAPYVENDRTFVPVRYLAEALDMDAAWDEKSQTVTLTTQKKIIESAEVPLKDLERVTNLNPNWDMKAQKVEIPLPQKEIKLVIGQKAMTVNGQQVQMDVAPVIRNGRTMLPARWVAENAGDYGVDWMDGLQMVQVWPLVKVDGKWRVPPENLRPAILRIRFFYDSERVEVDTAAGQHVLENGISMPYSVYVNGKYQRNGKGATSLPVEQVLRYTGFPVKYNVDYSNGGDVMTLYGTGWFGPMKVQMAIGDDKQYRAGIWSDPFNIYFGSNQGIEKPFRGPNGEFMEIGAMLGYKDHVFNKGSYRPINNGKIIIGTELHFDSSSL
ncbi:MAG: copper amine oxidase N-terminal domain-containing protein [Bacillota bacterium]